MPILPGIDGVREDVEVARQPHRRHRAAGGDVRARRCRIPDEAMDDVVRAAARRPSRRPGTSPRDAKRALARAIVERFHGAEAARGGRGALRPRPRRARGARGRSTSVELAAADGDRPPARRCSPSAFGISRSEARRLLAQGGVQARRRAAGAPTSSTSPAERLDGAVLQVGKRHFRRLRRELRRVAVHSGLLRLQTAGRRRRSSTSPRACARSWRARGVDQRAWSTVFAVGVDGRGDDDGVRAGRRARPPGGCSTG